MKTIQQTKGNTPGICKKRIVIEELNLELNGIGTEQNDFVLYYDSENRLGFEAEFDNGEFNGRVTFCENIGDDNEEWNDVTDMKIYEHIKALAINDFKRK